MKTKSKLIRLKPWRHHDDPVAEFVEGARLVACGVWCPIHEGVHPIDPAIQLAKGDSVQATCVDAAVVTTFTLEGPS